MRVFDVQGKVIYQEILRQDPHIQDCEWRQILLTLVLGQDGDNEEMIINDPSII